MRRKTHETIKKVSDDLERRLTFNTAIAAVMELLNSVNKFVDVSEQGRAVTHEALEAATLLLAPIAPHICHTLWRELGHKDAVAFATWPKIDESALTKTSQQMVVQVNGKVRAKLELPVGLDNTAIEAAAKADEKVARFIEDKTIRKVIVVPGKLVNIVAN
jgi:leucyl-tRNA synthetase